MPTRPFIPTETDKRRAAEIKRRRIENGLTQKQLAKQVGIDQRTLMRYEKLKRPIQSNVLDRFELALGRLDSPSHLFPSPHNGLHVPPALQAVISRRSHELTYAQVASLHQLAQKVHVPPDQWELIVIAMLDGQPHR